MRTQVGSASTVAPPEPGRRRRSARRLRHALSVLAVLAGVVGGGWLAMASYSADRELAVGTVRLSADPGMGGALDVYVPLVDWGARFDVVRAPVRLQVDVRAIDRDAARGIADGDELDIGDLRRQATDGIASYLRELLGIALVASLALGVLVAFAVRDRRAPRTRILVAVAAAGALVGTAGLAVLLPPRGPLADPEYYANGNDVPRALEALDRVQRSTDRVDQEFDAQLVGLARLVIAPSQRPALVGRPKLTVASDLHNNVLAVSLLERVADKGPLFMVGDLTDRGSPIEGRLLRRVVRAGRPFVFVTGNHDSDLLARRLARDGAIVLGETGRLLADGSRGPIVVRVGRLRVAGYGDRFVRRAADGYEDRYRREGPSQAQKEAFADWLFPLLNRVDVVAVHNVRLAEAALDRLRQGPPVRPLLLLTGHTHEAELVRQPGVTIVNGGTAGAGGTNNLAKGSPYGVARVIYDTAKGGFRPLAADLVELDPGTGSATARRERLDVPAGDAG